MLMKTKKEKELQTVYNAEDAYKIIIENKEKLVAAWIAATGIRPEKTMLIMRKYADNSIGWFCRELTEEDTQATCPKCGSNLIND